MLESEPMDLRLLKLQNQYSDEELLLELRRRGRFTRVEAETIAPDRYIVEGLTIEYQIERTWREVAYEAAKLHIKGKIPLGTKIENVRGDGTHMSPYDKGRRLRFALNFVVDK